MARYGVVADIQGNREALAAALAELDRRGVRRLACLGDIVGYNADPDECAATLRERRALAIAGNHDLIGLGRLDFSRCTNNAAYALRRTRRSLAPATLAYLASLPPTLEIEAGVVLVHGGVRDVQQYMTRPAHIAENAAFLREEFPQARICFFGHSHEARIYAVRGDAVEEIAPDRVELDRGGLYFINPGSVDASRKSRHKLAECAILDTAEWSIEFLRVRYDAAASETKAAAFGYRIPPWANRLYNLRRRIGGVLRRGTRQEQPAKGA